MKIEDLTEQNQSDFSKLPLALTAFWEIAAQGDLNKTKVHANELIQMFQYQPSEESSNYINLIEGILSYFKSESKNAERIFLNLLPPKINWQKKESEGIVRLFHGANYRSLGDYDKAVNELIRVHDLIEPANYTSTFSIMAFYLLGEIHAALEEFDQAEEYYTCGLKYGEQNTSNVQRFRILSGLGNLYLIKKEYNKCYEYLSLAFQNVDSVAQEGKALYDLAIYYEKTGDFDSALIHAEKSYEQRLSLNLLDAATTSQILIGKMYLQKGDLTNAIKVLEDALQATTKYNTMAKAQPVYQYLSEAYEIMGELKKSLSLFKKYEEIKSNIFLDQQKEIFRIKNKAIAEQKKVIEEFHKELKDSIRYARRIQSAILPSHKTITAHLPESFVLYKPKDIVSGDFYWMEKIEDIIAIAVADCTGHGVPGAMVSVVCHNAINKALLDTKELTSGRILDRTTDHVIDFFAKSEEDVKDGMDIALCLIDLKKKEMQFSGANNSLFLIRMGELIEIKGDKHPIGKYENRINFTTHHIALFEGDHLYIFSDGYADQFGGKEEKKLKTKAFKTLLLSIREKPMHDQKNIIAKYYEDWKGRNEQTDDVCVIGIKI